MGWGNRLSLQLPEVMGPHELQKVEAAPTPSAGEPPSLDVQPRGWGLGPLSQQLLRLITTPDVGAQFLVTMEDCPLEKPICPAKAECTARRISGGGGAECMLCTHNSQQHRPDRSSSQRRVNHPTRTSDTSPDLGIASSPGNPQQLIGWEGQPSLLRRLPAPQAPYHPHTGGLSPVSHKDTLSSAR